MTDAEAWDDAVIAARSRGASLGRVAKKFGATIQAVLEAQERVNVRRKAGEEVKAAQNAARAAEEAAAAAVKAAVRANAARAARWAARAKETGKAAKAAAKAAAEAEAAEAASLHKPAILPPFLRAYGGKRGIAWRVDEAYEDDDGHRRFRTLYDLGPQADRAAATREWEAAEARGDRLFYTRPVRVQKPRPPKIVIDPADLATIEQLAERWKVPVEKATRHVRRIALQSIQVGPDADAMFKWSDVLRWEEEAQRVFGGPAPERRDAENHRGR